MTTTTTMTTTTKTARLHAVWVRLAALLALLLALGVLAPRAGAQTTSITFFHNDVLGSPAVATDASGAVVWKESYLPYGHRLQAPAAGANNKLWYAGKQLDPNTGLSYMGARYYSPVVGRFMGIDPVEFQENNVHSFNRYAYANNNPYKYVDPDGRHPLLVFAAVGLFMVDFHHAATSNEPFTGVGGSVAPAGAKLAGVFARLAASEGGVAAKGLEIAPGKFDYLFGRVSSNAHNAARSNQLALEMKRLGVPDTAAGRQMLSEHLALSAKTEGNITHTFSNQYGNFEVRESLFVGPSGKAAKFESTFHVLGDGTRRLSTVIPFH